MLKNTYYYYCNNIEREISRKVQRPIFISVAYKLLSRFGLQSWKKDFSFNQVTSFWEREKERERESWRKKSFQTTKAVSGGPRAMEA